VIHPPEIIKEWLKRAPRELIPWIEECKRSVAESWAVKQKEEHDQLRAEYRQLGELKKLVLAAQNQGEKK
jgi:hypothetical protein